MQSRIDGGRTSIVSASLSDFANQDLVGKRVQSNRQGRIALTGKDCRLYFEHGLDDGLLQLVCFIQTAGTVPSD